jgi:hypothetical protein
MPVILAPWEAEIGRIVIRDQIGKIVCETTPISKTSKAKMDWRCGSSGRAPALQAQIPEFKAKKQNFLFICETTTFVKTVFC